MKRFHKWWKEHSFSPITIWIRLGIFVLFMELGKTLTLADWNLLSQYPIGKQLLYHGLRIIFLCIGGWGIISILVDFAHNLKR